LSHFGHVKLQNSQKLIKRKKQIFEGSIQQGYNKAEFYAEFKSVRKIAKKSTQKSYSEK
jgi:hypothetical protein